MRAFLSLVSILLTSVVAWSTPVPMGVYHADKDVAPNVVHVVTEVVYARGPYGQQRLHRLMKDQKFKCQNMGEALFRCIHHEAAQSLPSLVAEVPSQFEDLEVQFVSSQNAATESLDDGWVTPQLVSVHGETLEGQVFQSAQDDSSVVFQKASQQSGPTFLLESDGTLKYQIQAGSTTRRNAHGLPRTETYLVYMALTGR